MQQFKQGDRVKRINCNFANALVGKQYTVDKVYGGGSVELREIDGSYSAKHFVLCDKEAVPPVRDDSNPKDAVAQLKVDTSLVPDVALAHIADALMDGAKKYGPFNWRDKKVQARVYVAAARRHLAQWLDREETAEDSGVHHLGHAAACLAILLDAQHYGCLLDNRPDNKGLRLQDLFDNIQNRRKEETNV